MDKAIEQAVARRQRGVGKGSEGRFSVSATEAMLALRNSTTRRKHAYLTPMLRLCGRVLEGGLFRCDLAREPDGTRTSFRLSLVGLPLEQVELRDLLGASLGGEFPAQEAAGLERGAVEAASQAAHLRRRLAEAVNALLALGPDQVTLACAAGVRVWQRRASPAPSEDPYAMSSGVLAELEPHEVLISVKTPSASFGARLTGWLVGSDPINEITEVCAALLGPSAVGTGAEARKRLAEGLVVTPLAASSVSLGGHARFSPDLDTRSCFLVRDGVRLLSLDAALASEGIPAGTICGAIECDSLALTIDGDSVVRDGNLELLVAWLREYLSAGRSIHQETGRQTLGDSVVFADGRVVARDLVLLNVLRGHELIVAWPWERDRVPHLLRARVALLVPSQFAALRAALPSDVAVVRLAALGQIPQLEPFDFESLLQGSLDPLPLVQGMLVPAHPYLSVSVTAYVHRYPAAVRGRNLIIAFGRRVSDSADEARTLTGVSVVCRVLTKDGRTLDELRSDRGALEGTSALLDDLVVKHRDSIITHVIAQTQSATRTDGVLRPPLWTACVDSLSAAGLRVRYSYKTSHLDGAREMVDEINQGARDTDHQDAALKLYLTWDEAPSLALVIGRRGNRDLVTLREALRELARFGFLVVATGSTSAGLPTDEERKRAMTLDGELGPALGRVIPAPLWRSLGDRGLARMVTDEPAVLLGLLRTREEIVADLAGALGPDERARERLLGHLLAARILGEEEFGLATVPMLLLYDPRALAPTRLVSLAALEGLSPRPGLAPVGTSDRRLPSSVIEVAPLLAWLLHRVVGMVPATHRLASNAGGASMMSAMTATSLSLRRAAPPLASLAIRDAVAVGNIRLANSTQAGAVALWQDGVHIRDIKLQEPLAAVSGRLWVARDVPAMRIEALLVEAGAELLRSLARTLPLQPPGSGQRERGSGFVRRTRTWLAQHRNELDPRLEALHEIFRIDGAVDPLEPAIDRTLRSWPLRPLRGPETGWLGQLLSHSLGLRLDVSTAVLSWKALRVLQAGPGNARVELGLRHALVHAAVVSGEVPATYLALPFAIADYFQDVVRVREVEIAPVDRHLAYWRALAQLVTQTERGPRRPG